VARLDDRRRAPLDAEGGDPAQPRRDGGREAERAAPAPERRSGFRVESRLFPKLHQEGSGGSYYTQADINEIVAYADRPRHPRRPRVRPARATPRAGSSPIPSSGSAPGPYTLAREYGIHDATLDPTREEVYEFLDRFIGEMARLFPDPFVHIGGDEVSGKTHWNSNARIQRFMREHKLDDRHALQAYFNRRLQKILANHGEPPSAGTRS
jgi:hexosaminidase